LKKNTQRVGGEKEKNFVRQNGTPRRKRKKRPSKTFEGERDRGKGVGEGLGRDRSYRGPGGLKVVRATQKKATV